LGKRYDGAEHEGRQDSFTISGSPWLSYTSE